MEKTKHRIKLEERAVDNSIAYRMQSLKNNQSLLQSRNKKNHIVI